MSTVNAKHTVTSVELPNQGHSSPNKLDIKFLLITADHASPLFRKMFPKSGHCQTVQMFKVFILRNYIAQKAIEKAENGDFSSVRKLVEILENPYDQCYTKAINEAAANAQNEEDFCPTAKISTMASQCHDVYDKPPSSAFSLKLC
ncbi:UNVERIFIED_CONTAM: Selenoo [Trichonephila clavipes]